MFGIIFIRNFLKGHQNTENLMRIATGKKYFLLSDELPIFQKNKTNNVYFIIHFIINWLPMKFHENWKFIGKLLVNFPFHFWIETRV